MRTALFSLFTILLATTASAAQLKLPCCSTFDHGHAVLDKLLRDHVDGDNVDYAALKKSSALLGQYLDGLEKVTPEEFGAWEAKQRYAFWINAYNAYTLQRVIDNYPVASIKDIGSTDVSVWDAKFIPLGPLADLKETKISLNQVEHDILRPVFKDARVHAAVNCASRGCPPLLAGAFVADKLDEQLSKQVRAWLSDPQRNRFDDATATLHASKIFEWFKDDFVRDGGDVIEWVRAHGPKDLARRIGSAKKVKLRYLEYSWELNDTKQASN